MTGRAPAGWEGGEVRAGPAGGRGWMLLSPSLSETNNMYFQKVSYKLGDSPQQRL